MVSFDLQEIYDVSVSVCDGRVFRDGTVGELLSSAVLSELFGVPERLEEKDGWRRMW